MIDSDEYLDCDAILGPEGPFAQHLTGFQARPGQQQMASAIAQALEQASVFIAESGTGTGKTYAYLVPALLSGSKVLISTGTKNLQDQLYHRDLPLVQQALHSLASTALLKGRSNYLCRHRFELAGIEGRFASRQQSAEWVRLQDWANRTDSGDIAEVSEIPEESGLWPRVTSSTDNCLGSQCDHYDQCFVNRARRQALEADVLVVNHHLFFADLVLREEGFGQLLPGVDAVIFDEAHQLPEIASLFFGQNLSSRQLNQLCRDAQNEEVKAKSLVDGLTQTIKTTEKAVADFRLAFGVQPRRDTWASVQQDEDLIVTLEQLRVQLAELAQRLDRAAAKSQGLANCYRRAVELTELIERFQQPPHSDTVNWFETSKVGFLLHMTPLEVASGFQQQLQAQERAWVFTSATLAINQRFDHFQKQLGLDAADTKIWPSPFDYAEQTLLYLPAGLPNPSQRDYTAAVVEAALPVLKASRGRAFFLFTSYRALHLAAELLPQHIDYPLLVQGTLPRAALLQRFLEQDNAILLGTGSFWEGVDVRGEALSCVIIDKLPFAAPDDPVLRARTEAIARDGRNAFMDYQVPQAVISLKQGVGRLIRDASDCGVLMLCDPRIVSKGYGRIFLRSLPPMPITQEVTDVEGFFQRLDRLHEERSSLVS